MKKAYVSFLEHEQLFQIFGCSYILCNQSFIRRSLWSFKFSTRKRALNIKSIIAFGAQFSNVSRSIQLLSYNCFYQVLRKHFIDISDCVCVYVCVYVCV